MLCQECKENAASLHFTKIVNGQKTEFHLCDSCAREKGDFIPGSKGFSIHNLLSGLLDFEPSAGENALGAKPAILRCEQCGLTYNQFGKTGRFGCSECYKAFSGRLDPLFKRVHGNIAHVGKIPKRRGGVIRQRREVEQLKMELRQAVEQEEFEKAAELRDRIRGLEKQISGE